MNRKILLLFLLVVWLLPAERIMGADITPLTLAVSRNNLQTEFDRLTDAMRQTAAQLGKSNLTGDAARAALADLCSRFNWAIDCAAVDSKGVMVTIEPHPFRRFEGISIAQQEQVARLLTEHKPVMSSVFTTVEGVPAVDVEYPVATSGGEYLGAVSLLFKPEKLLAAAIKPATKGVPMDVWVMETGGLILYDVDTRQIGLNLFTDPLYQSYPSLISLGRQIARDPSGSGSYKFLDRTGKKVITKKTYWQTASLYGVPWRLVGVHPEAEQPAVVVDQPRQQQVVNNLDTLVGTKSLATALAKNDRGTVVKIFKKFHEENPQIYSIQWLDAKGVTRFGVPAENSLFNYDFRAGRTADDLQVIKVLEARRAATREAPIFEGDSGVFFYRPVFKGKRYLGMIYLILRNQ